MRGFTSLSTAAFALVRGHKTMRTLPIRSSTSTSSSHHHLSYSQILKQRRAVRNFDSQREVTTDILLKILKESQSAPSSFNLQPYKVITNAYNIYNIYTFVFIHTCIHVFIRTLMQHTFIHIQGDSST